MVITKMSEILSVLNVYYLLASLAAFYLLRAVARKYWTQIRDVPGPFFASFSSLWRVYHIWKGHSEKEILKLHKEHGYFVRIADNEVSVSHPDAVKQLLQANIEKGSFYSMFSLPDYRYINQMSELEPTRHIQKTRSLSAGFSLSNIAKTEPYIDNVLKLFMTRFDELCASGTPVEFQNWFSFFAFDVLGEVTFSKSFGFVQSGIDIRNAIANTGALVYYISVIGNYLWFHHLTLGNPLFSRLGLQPSSHIFDTCLLAIESRKKNPEVRHDMMQRWLDVREKQPDRLTENDIFGAAVANIGAGAETVSATAQAVVYNLIRLPELLKKVTEEIDTAQMRGELSQVVQFSEAIKLPFLQACIRESYRIHPGVSHNLPRVVPKGGITIAGRYFPQGVLLSVNPWIIHRDPDIFGEDSEIFNPDRWLQGETKTMDFFMIHWGAGYNQCPGRHLAHFELTKVLTTLFRDYDIEKINPKEEWKFDTRFLAVPYGWPCRIRKRQRS